MSYVESPSKILSQGKKHVDKLSEYIQETWADVQIPPTGMSVQKRVLEVVVPPGATAAQREALDALVEYGLKNAPGNPVTVLIRELP